MCQHRSRRLPYQRRSRLQDAPSRQRKRSRLLTIEPFETRRLLATVQLEPIADNTLFEDVSGALSNGSGDHLFAGRVAQGGGGKLRRGLIQFDLSEIPTEAIVNSVTVSMSVSRSISGSVPVGLHRASESWGEGTSNAPGQEGTGTAATAGDATWVHRVFPSISWQNAGGNFAAQASATQQVSVNGRYSWTDAALADDVRQWLADPSSNHGWFVIGDEQNLGTAKRFDSRENAVPANRPQLTIDFEAPPSFDFGDAPAASQSGFASDYPVLQSDDGARHMTGDLVLGLSVDSESDGIPSEGAIGDGADEDGIRFLTSMVSTNTPTKASLLAIASATGKLDAWIDFNRDGDWDDPNERILLSQSLTPGENLLAFEIPAGASHGYTGARFRISTAGGLAPTGPALDGEVEDYFVEIVDGQSPSATSITLDVDTGVSDLVFVDAGDLTISAGSTERFRAPASSIADLVIHGRSTDDTIVLRHDAGFPNPLQELRVNGNGGVNTITIEGSGPTIDLTAPNFVLQRFASVALRDADGFGLIVSPSTISEMAPETQRVRFSADRGTRINVVSPDQWRLTAPIRENQQFIMTATAQTTEQQLIEAEIQTPWQNFLNPLDVSNDGAVTPRDALLIINEIARGTYTNANSSTLINPIDVSPWPNKYLDTSGDGNSTPLDALRVINFIARQTLEPESPQAVLAVTQPKLAISDSANPAVPWEPSPISESTPKTVAMGIAIRSAQSDANGETGEEVSAAEIHSVDEVLRCLLNEYFAQLATEPIFEALAKI